jgi:hypothetical protein
MGGTDPQLRLHLQGVEQGLIDFLHAGAEVVFLCWQLGERPSAIGTGLKTVCRTPTLARCRQNGPGGKTLSLIGTSISRSFASTLCVQIQSVCRRRFVIAK